MSFDSSQPTPTTKIRNLSTVIPDNFAAIEDADSSFKPVGLNLDNRTPLAVSNDPAAIAEAMVAYCKDDSNGDPQLYAIDPSSTISALTPFTSTIAKDGLLTLPGGLVFIWGSTTGTTGAKTFHTAFSNNCHNLQVTIRDPNALYGSASNVTTVGFTWTTSNSSAAINYFAIGN